MEFNHVSNFFKKNHIISILVLATITLTFHFSKASITSEHPEKPFLSSLPVLLLTPSLEYKPEEDQLTLHPERGLFFSFLKPNGYNFSYKLQGTSPDSPQAPAIFIIPGIGGVPSNKSVMYLSELAYNLGYSVITLTSSTHWSFAMAASSSGRTGHLPDDSRDLYNIIKHIKTKLEKKHHFYPSKWGILGSSYGTLDGSFLMAQDLKEKSFNFEFLFLINPPLNRSTAIAKVDDYFATGDQWPSKKKTSLKFEFLNRFNLFKILSIDSYETFRFVFPMEESELAWLMSKNFRDIILNSALIGNKLENIETKSANEAFNGNIIDYLRERLYKKHHKAHSPDDYFKLEQESNLTSILNQNNAEILTSKKVILFHSTNDYLSFPEGSSTLNELNKIEQHIYPFGGHLGILTDDNVIKDIQSSLVQLKY